MSLVSPSWRVSTGVWVAALAIDVLVPLRARGVEIVHCQDGATNLGINRVALVSFVVVPTLLALWRCVVHFFDEASRRLMVAWVAAALVAAAAIGVTVGLAAMGVGDGITFGDGC